MSQKVARKAAKSPAVHNFIYMCDNGQSGAFVTLGKAHLSGGHYPGYVNTPQVLVMSIINTEKQHVVTKKQKVFKFLQAKPNEMA